MKRQNTKTIVAKKDLEKISMLTAYDAIFAHLADKAGVDIILIGDSLGNTFMGYESTIPVTIEDMIHHTAMVARAKPSALIVADIPFAVAHYSFDILLTECAKLLRAGADAVKIEGGADMAEKIAKLVSAGVPVMGHIGLMPQQVLKLGAYKTFGKTDIEKVSLLEDAKKLDDAGAFSIVLEKIDETCAQEITKSISIPTIGIGAGKACDGQVLVSSDLLGLQDWAPPFVKKYANLSETVEKAFAEYIKDVKSSNFPL